MRVLDLPEPVLLSPEHVLIDVQCAGVGNWDDIVRSGGWNIGCAPPMALGVEAAGIVRDIGPAVTRFRVGDAVLAHAMPVQQGAWAERWVALESQVAHKPVEVAWTVAAALPVPALTAHQVLDNALGLQPGETVLVHGAGGITGGLLVSLAADVGATVIGTAGPRNTDRLMQLGAADVVDYHAADWPERVRKLCPGGLPAAVNAVRGQAGLIMPLVASGGRLATITGDPPLEVRGIRISNCYVQPDGRALEQVATRLAHQRVSIPLAATYPLFDAAAALARVVSGSGPVVLEVR
ncbi:MAG: NADP-dependent oxidoreductase [Chloroflexi bacterium]|nr:NADP-dependent oxidoreductase [Chloroflexota bacterium]